MKSATDSPLGTMKTIRMILAGVTIVILPNLAATSQDAAKLPEPEYVNSFYILDSAGNLKPLERQPVGVAAKSKALGLGGMGVSYEIQNEHSPVRIGAGAPLEIVVKLETRDVDPATIVLLYPLTIAKGKRQLLISGVHGFISHQTRSDLQNKQTQMVFTKHGQASLKIEPASPLAPGEYAITVQSRDQQPTAYCFGIDPITK